jgi:hypothetical protein
MGHVVSATHQEAGAYARERHRDGLRRYRRRMRPYLLLFLATSALAYQVTKWLHGIDAWSFWVGVAVGGLVSITVWIHDEPPEFIAKWGRGADGEEMTGKAIKPLLDAGWKVRHDVDLGRGNADHVLLSPTGKVFLVETKTLAGQLTVERGQLTCRFVDAPEEVRRYDLESRMQRLVQLVEEKWERSTGRPAPGIQPLVVVWGAFASEVIEGRDLTYVRGNALTEFLRRVS